MNETLVASVLEINDIGVYSVNLKDGSVTYSPAASRALTEEQTTSFTHAELTDFLLPSDQFIRQTAWSEMLRTGRLEYEPHVVWKDGTVRRLRIQARCEFDENGQPERLAGIIYDITNQPNASRLQLETERHFRSIIEQSPVAMCLLRGPNLILEIANQRFTALAGKDQTIIGKPFRAAIPELTRQGYIDILEGVFETGEPVQGTERRVLLDRNGEKLTAYFNVVCSPLKHPDGRVSGVIITANEVTDQVISKRQVEQSELRFRALIEQAPVATCLFSGKEMRIEVANQIMLRYLGKDTSVIGMPLMDAVPELVGQPFNELLENTYETGRAYEAREMPAELKIDGVKKTYYFDFTYKPIRNAAGEVYGILNMAVDVTDRVVATKKLKESELFSRSIIYNSPVAKAVFLGEDMIIDTVNENMLIMIGRDASIIGKRFVDAIPEMANTPTAEKLKQVYSTGETFYQPEEKIHLVRFGEPYEGYYNYIYKALRDTDGHIYGVIVTVVEVTDQVVARRKVEELTESLERLVAERTEQLQAVNEELTATNEELAELNQSLIFSNEELQQFAHVASHDLKEPIRKIKIFLNRIETDSGNTLTDRSRAFMNKVHVATDRMFSMIEGVLTYSTVNASQQKLQEIDLNKIMDEISLDLEVLIAQKNASIRSEKLPRIEGAPILIYQLFYNLIANALKFTKPDTPPVIEIFAREELINEKRMAVIEMHDNGIGFDQEDANKIFNTFTRLNSKDAFEGTGLGLSLCKKIVQRHGGSIEARGVKGEGATFIVSLPLPSA